MSTHAKLIGKHQYVEFKEETVAKRVQDSKQVKSDPVGRIIPEGRAWKSSTQIKKGYGKVHI